ncbi:MAG: hypothetical protein QG611_1429 [Bacteroidota bacterium]|nr:hypothetical protein [Bacteroidota bacterium]
MKAGISFLSGGINSLFLQSVITSWSGYPGLLNTATTIQRKASLSRIDISDNKTKTMKRIVFILLIAWAGISCTKNNDTEITQIKYGTSFGECMGYCKKDILLKSGCVTYSRSGWIDTLETITCTEKLNDVSWNSYKSGLDTGFFFELPQSIGCPDCADGGSEWIEIEVASGKKHKVTFEYMNEPDGLKDYIIGLREQIGQSSHCGE